MFCSISKFPILVAAAVVACQAAAPLSEPIATMTSTGAVQVGAAFLEASGVRSWPVLAGDQISTDVKSSALISSPAMGTLRSTRTRTCLPAASKSSRGRKTAMGRS